MANNTITAIAVGAGLIGMALFLRQLFLRRPINSEAWAVFFAVVGSIMAVVGFTTTVMWPYGTGELAYANIHFGEPAAAFGVLALGGAVLLWRQRALFAGEQRQVRAVAFNSLRPLSIFVGVLGLSMVALAITWVRFQMGAAPEFEPVSGNFGQWPWLEATFLGGLWGLVAIGAVVFPFAVMKVSKLLVNIVVVTWLLAGIVFSLFGSLNMYTHIGMYYNLSHHTSHKW